MTARVLVVDDVAVNRKLLEARLSAEYFEVHAASSGLQAIEQCASHAFDIILLDVMMPGIDGYETCHRLKNHPDTAHIPIIMITALDQPTDRIKGLEAGADDFLSKPVDDVQLLARVKSLVRLKVLTDELRARARTGASMRFEVGVGMLPNISVTNGKVALIDEESTRAERLKERLAHEHQVTIFARQDNIVERVAQGEFELVIVPLALKMVDPLRLCSQIRTLERTRQTPILIVANPQDKDRTLRALELGVNDFIELPSDPSEFAARAKVQIRRSRYTEALRENVNTTMALAITDELTGLYNRRYLERHTQSVLERASEEQRPVSMLILDIDHFKRVNDTFGHDAGDEVLREFSSRLRTNVRGVDLACRFGGEEFVVVMPSTDLETAENIAERIRLAVAMTPFQLPDGQQIHCTVSVGVSRQEGINDNAQAMLKRADTALYRAKHSGRNKVLFESLSNIA